METLPTYQTRDEMHGVRLLKHYDGDGVRCGMHMNVKDGYLFFAHQGDSGTSIIDIREPRDPRLVGRIPAPKNTQGHNVQIVGDILLVNRERNAVMYGGSEQSPWAGGLSIFDISDPTQPREISYWSCGGKGVHRMSYWTEPYAYVTAGQSDSEHQILVVLDLSDPAHPIEAGRWWYSGMRYGEEAERRRHPEYWTPDRRVKFHHGVPRGDRLYGGWCDIGAIILDVGDPANPRLVSHLDIDAVDAPSRNTHSVVPIPDRDALVVTDEASRIEFEYFARVVDISNETEPKVVSRFPVPEGDFRSRGGRFGPHNVHEPRPGSFISKDFVFMTYFNGGVRVYDISDLTNPVEVAWFVPKAPRGRPAIQMDDVYVDESGLIFATERYTGGLYIMVLTI